MEKSIWKEFSEKKNFEKLNDNLECDVLVIGGGMAGIFTAYYLQKVGRNVVLVEAHTIGSGMTANTTAVITAQHDTMYKDMIANNGFDVAKDYLYANLQAVENFKQLVEDEQIDCDFEITPSYLYSHKHSLEDEVKALHKLGYEAELVQDIDLPFEIKNAVKFKDMAQFHPLKFLYAMAEKLTIYEHTMVKKIDDHTAYFDGGNIKFKQAVVASHFPFVNKHGMFFIKMYQARSYVMAIENADAIGGTYIDDREEGFYFRQYGDLLLVGKGEHRTGMKTRAINELKAFKERYYPDAKMRCMWANQDCITLDDIPYIGEYGNMPDVYVATGFNLWGMTGSMVSANILCEKLCGMENIYEKTFATKRCIFKPQLFANLGMALLNMVYPSVKRCPHLGCALKYNKLEHSWDCSCHGSRFEENGKLINNPALKDKSL